MSLTITLGDWVVICQPGKRATTAQITGLTNPDTAGVENALGQKWPIQREWIKHLLRHDDKFTAFHPINPDNESGYR